MKLKFLAVFSISLLAQETSTPNKKDETKEKIEKLEKDNKQLNQVLQAYQQKFFTCDTQLTVIQATK